MIPEYLHRPAETGTITWLLRRCEESAHELFLIAENEKITYGELLKLVQKWAGVLAGSGVDEDSRVAVMMRNHVDHIAIVFALQWLNAVHVPISTHQRASGLEVQFETAAPYGVIAEDAFAVHIEEGLKLAGVTAFILLRPEGLESGSAWSREIRANEAPSFRDRGLEAPAMIAFTSGTTGRPKGAVLSERFLMESARQASILSDLQPPDRLFMWEPLYHAPGWTTLRMAMAAGATVAMVEKFSASRCWDQIRETSSTKLHYLGGVINLLLKQPPSVNDRDHAVTIAWGGAAPRDSWRAFEERFGVTIREGYGLTEAANFAMLNLEGRVGSIGKPTDDMEAWIEDPESGSVLPQGEVGQIVVRPRRPGLVMLGYYGDPEATQKVLAGGSVRTGDLGYESDGYYYFTGRASDSLRRRGENVSAWEVERVVNEHRGVAESAVIGVPSEMGEDDVKLFVKVAPEKTLNVEELWEWCSTHLAYYQVPRYIEVVDEFPYGPTQRIQKRLLPTTTTGIFDADRLVTRSTKTSTRK